jgi:hypothetical protein
MADDRRDTPSLPSSATGSVEHALDPGREGLAYRLGFGRVALQALLGQAQLVALGFPVIDRRTAPWALGWLRHGAILCPYKYLDKWCG